MSAEVRGNPLPNRRYLAVQMAVQFNVKSENPCKHWIHGGGVLRHTFSVCKGLSGGHRNVPRSCIPKNHGLDWMSVSSSAGSVLSASESRSRLRMVGSLRPLNQLDTATSSAWSRPRRRATSAEFKRLRSRIERNLRAKTCCMGSSGWGAVPLSHDHAPRARTDLTAQNRRHAAKMVGLSIFVGVHGKRLAR